MSKSFKESAQNALSNPAMQFITAPAVPRTPEPEPQSATPAKECKSRRLQLLIKPSIHEAIKERAAQNGTSVNDWINGALERALGTGEAVTIEELIEYVKQQQNSEK